MYIYTIYTIYIQYIYIYTHYIYIQCIYIYIYNIYIYNTIYIYISIQYIYIHTHTIYIHIHILYIYNILYIYTYHICIYNIYIYIYIYIHIIHLTYKYIQRSDIWHCLIFSGKNTFNQPCVAQSYSEPITERYNDEKHIRQQDVCISKLHTNRSTCSKLWCFPSLSETSTQSPCFWVGERVWKHQQVAVSNWTHIVQILQQTTSGCSHGTRRGRRCKTCVLVSCSYANGSRAAFSDSDFARQVDMGGSSIIPLGTANYPKWIDIGLLAYWNPCV